MSEERAVPTSHRLASILLAVCLVVGFAGVAAGSPTGDLDGESTVESDRPDAVTAADVDPCGSVLQPVVDEVGVPVVVPSCSVP